MKSTLLNVDEFLIKAYYSKEGLSFWYAEKDGELVDIPDRETSEMIEQEIIARCLLH